MFGKRISKVLAFQSWAQIGLVRAQQRRGLEEWEWVCGKAGRPQVMKGHRRQGQEHKRFVSRELQTALLW